MFVGSKRCTTRDGSIGPSIMGEGKFPGLCQVDVCRAAFEGLDTLLSTKYTANLLEPGSLHPQSSGALAND